MSITLFPSSVGSVIDAPAKHAPASIPLTGVSPIFDHSLGDFQFDSTGNPVLGTPASTFLQRVKTLLLTPPQHYRCYRGDFGNELINHLGDNIEYVQGIAKQSIVRALEGDDFVKTITSVSVVTQGDTLTATVKLQSIAGQDYTLAAQWVNS